MELLGFYTFKSHHYLLFPPAASDLGQLLYPPAASDLDQVLRDSPFLRSEFNNLLALSGLASAVEKLHNYESEILHVSLIGCHHDLKPKNVLVDEGKFLLADFGLSKFKNVSEDSKSPFGRGEGCTRMRE